MASIFTAGTLLTASVSATPVFNDLFFFGDSLSDSGNIRLLQDSFPEPPPNTSVPIPGNSFIPGAPYDRGPGLLPAFSNGPVASEILAARLGLGPLLPSLAGGNNFAFGGAQFATPASPLAPPSVSQQVDQFVARVNGASATPLGQDAPNDALYVLFAGGNDARNAFEAAADGGNPADFVTDYAQALAGAVQGLVSEGAEDIVVFNVPDIGLTPAIGTLGPQVAAAASGLSASFNAAYDQTLNSLDALFAASPLIDANLVRFDLAGLLQDVSANPAAFGFTNTTDACGASADCVADPTGFLFFDGIHTTTAGQAVVADRVLAAFATVPEPQSLALVVIGFALVAGAQRRVG